MTLPATIAPKVGKLIPRLGSSYDCEVVATARAIERTLKSGGADLHDLARAVDRSSTGESPEPEFDLTPRPWREMLPAMKLQWLGAMLRSGRLSSWELQFACDLRDMIRSGVPETDKQVAVLDRLVERLWKGGRR